MTYTSPAPIDAEDKTIFGFWVYLMTDMVIFAALFAVYAVLRNNTAGGPGGAELFNLPFIMVGTLALLTSSFTSGLAVIAMQSGKVKVMAALFIITALLGATFLGLEVYEFTKLIEEGNSWQRSAFLSAFFVLVGTHGAHITAGLVWLSVLMIYVAKRGLNPVAVKRLTMFSMFWHFLDLVWIFIFTIVYLMGVV